jgi:hypothetical protein
VGGARSGRGVGGASGGDEWVEGQAVSRRPGQRRVVGDGEEEILSENDM